MLLLNEFYPSYEVRCLLRMSSTPYKAVFCRYPQVESTGELPQVQDGSALVGNDRALHYVRELTRLGSTLSASERAYSLGLLSLVQSTLKGVERWSLHLGPKGGRRAAECIHRVTPAPLSWLVAAGLRSSNMERLAQGGLVEEAWVRERAVEAYKALDTVLANNGGGPFFFGASPTPLDAAVYGHLSAIRHCVPGTWVKESAPGLVRFYVELRGRYFAGGVVDSSSNPFDAEDRRLDKKRLEEGSTEGEAFFALRFATGLQAGTSPETEQLVKIGVTACILGVTGVMVWAFVTKRGSGGR